MTSPDDTRRKRLYFRCHHTGMKENDIVFGAFAERHLSTLSDDEVAWLEAFLMNNNDIDIYNWIVGNRPLPAEIDHPLLHRVIASVGIR